MKIEHAGGKNQAVFLATNNTYSEKNKLKEENSLGYEQKKYTKVRNVNREIVLRKIFITSVDVIN